MVGIKRQVSFFGPALLRAMGVDHFASRTHRVPPEVEPFHAITISRLAHSLKVEGRSIIHMEFGQPSTGAPHAAIAKAHAVLDADGMGYWESPALKARIARRYATDHGIDVHPDRILLTTGASPGLVLALSSLFEPGDRIALARPNYVSYRNTLRALHLTPVETPCGATRGSSFPPRRLPRSIRPPPASSSPARQTPPARSFRRRSFAPSPSSAKPATSASSRTRSTTA